ncbi:MAG: hypothetical protein Q9227_004645 [Pyrenula ochraceoflavens]
MASLQASELHCLSTDQNTLPASASSTGQNSTPTASNPNHIPKQMPLKGILKRTTHPILISDSAAQSPAGSHAPLTNLSASDATSEPPSNGTPNASTQQTHTTSDCKMLTPVDTAAPQRKGILKPPSSSKPTPFSASSSSGLLLNLNSHAFQPSFPLLEDNNDNNIINNTNNPFARTTISLDPFSSLYNNYAGPLITRLEERLSTLTLENKRKRLAYSASTAVATKDNDANADTDADGGEEEEEEPAGKRVRLSDPLNPLTPPYRVIFVDELSLLNKGPIDTIFPQSSRIKPAIPATGQVQFSPPPRTTTRSTQRRVGFVEEVRCIPPRRVMFADDVKVACDDSVLRAEAKEEGRRYREEKRRRRAAREGKGKGWFEGWV